MPTLGLLIFLLFEIFARSAPSMNQSLFFKHRPKFHFLPTKNWINDPCGPFLDKQGTYHLYFQLNINVAEWGDIVWGHATSKDLVKWTDQPVAIKPSQPYDSLHVFSGMIIPNGYESLPTAFYTGVSYTPINWKLPYKRGCEKQVFRELKQGYGCFTR